MTEPQIIQDEKDASVTILGVSLVKRPFTQAEMDEWARIHDQRELDTAKRRMLALTAESQQLSNKRVELQKKAVAALEAKLDREYDREKWDSERIHHLTDRILTENERLAELQEQDGERFAQASFSVADRIDEANAVLQEANLEMAHFVAGKPRPFQEWLEAATSSDYQSARELVQAGQTPFASRRIRRARSGKGTR